MTGSAANQLPGEPPIPVLGLEGVSKTFGAIRALDAVDFDVMGGEVHALLGENGAGKTTIIKTITGEIPPLAGEIKRKPGLTVQMLEQARVCGPDKMPVLTWFFEQIARLPNSDQGFFDHSTARTFLHRFLFKGDDVFKQIGHLSAGERARLCFASIMASKPDLLILDEPTNNLDISLIECLEDALNEYSGALIVASHDRYFREKIGVQSLWAIEGKRLAVRAE